MKKPRRLNWQQIVVSTALGMLAVERGAAAADLPLKAPALMAVRGWERGAPYLNFLDHAADTSTAYSVETAERLRRVRAIYDPACTWVAAHPLPEAVA